MLEIRCDTATNGTGHFLARINDGVLELWCTKCKAWHKIPVSDLVRSTVIDLKHTAQDGGEKQLLW